MKYSIHTCNDRLWYVQDYLVPSMVEQGINKFDINIWLDKDNEGCLQSCMKAFLSMPINNKDTWHMQDDVIISHDFKEKTEQKYGADIVCGYCYSLDGHRDITGFVEPKHMWYSFPCIRIPNKVARYCADWFYRKVMRDPAYGIYVRSKRFDDSLFHIFIEEYGDQLKILNLTPNIVDHIDYLIGGSIINYTRPEKETHAAYFEDEYLVKNLENILLNNS